MTTDELYPMLRNASIEDLEKLDEQLAARQRQCEQACADIVCNVESLALVLAIGISTAQFLDAYHQHQVLHYELYRREMHSNAMQN